MPKYLEPLQRLFASEDTASSAQLRNHLGQMLRACCRNRHQKGAEGCSHHMMAQRMAVWRDAPALLLDAEDPHDRSEALAYAEKLDGGNVCPWLANQRCPAKPTAGGGPL